MLSPTPHLEEVKQEYDRYSHLLFDICSQFDEYGQLHITVYTKDKKVSFSDTLPRDAKVIGHPRYVRDNINYLIRCLTESLLERSE